MAARALPMLTDMAVMENDHGRLARNQSRYKLKLLFPPSINDFSWIFSKIQIEISYVNIGVMSRITRSLHD
jgi:hypothetical protein